MSDLLPILAAYRTNEACDNLVNGKPALEWGMERQSVTSDKTSGITNDAKLCAAGLGGLRAS